MQHPDLDEAHLRTWIGRKEVHEDFMDAGLAARWQATFDRTDALGNHAPLMIHHCLGQPAAPTKDLGRDGHPEKGGFLPPVPLPRRMWAGGEIRFPAPLRIGAQVWRHSEISDVRVKTGRTGTLCFVAVDHRIEDERGLVLEERQDIVYRADPTDPTPPRIVPPPTEAHERKSVTPSAPFLFRYSAMTFNGHRIHYDHPYATQQEGYDGLVVHGPVQAALLCQFAADLKAVPPVRFAFRGVAPLTGTDDFDMCAATDGRRLILWTERDGATCMTAEAEWS